VVYLEVIDGYLAFQEELHDVFVDIWYHRGVVVRVVPPPVLSPSVVVVEDPLQSLEILQEHLSLEDGALGGGHILLQLGHVIECFGLDGISCKHLNKLRHEFEVLLTVPVDDLLLSLDLCVQCGCLKLFLNLVYVYFRLVHVWYLIIGDVTRAEVAKVLLLDISDDIWEKLDLALLELGAAL